MKGIEGMFVSERTEVIPPSKDVIRLTEAILEQNGIILEMNADLLKILTNPLMVINDKQDAGVGGG